MRRGIFLLAQALTVAVVLLLWQTVSKAQANLVSRPSDVWQAFTHWLGSPLLRGYIPVTLMEAYLGLAIALAGAVVLASCVAASRFLSEVASPFIAVLNAAPKIALAPLFLLVFGLGTSSKVYFVAAAVFFIPFYSIYTGLRTVDQSYVNNTKMLGASKVQLLREVYVPSITTSAIASLRIAATFALLAAVISEMIESQKGIGYEINVVAGNLQNNDVMAGVLIITILALAIDRILLLLERRLTRWRTT